MREQTIYRKQWLSLCVILVIAVISHLFVLTIWFTGSDNAGLYLISGGILIISLLALHLNNRFLLKKAEKQTASELTADQSTSANLFPLLSSAIQQKKESLSLDVEKIRKINSELEHKVLLDSLTGLQNRSAFRKDLTAFLQSKNTSDKTCLCLIRSTELTTINKQWGRIAGDEYLTAIAEIIQIISRRFSTNSVYRLSGSDYAILIPNASPSMAPVLGKELKQLFDNLQMQLATESIAYSGITLLHPGQKPEQLLARADLALAKAQTSAINGWYVQEEDSTDDIFQGENHWRQVIQSIIETRNVGFYGQEIQPLNMAICNYIQIIPRFTGTNLQPLPVETVYAMAMRHGMMNKLEELVVEKLLQQQKQRPKNLTRWGLNLSASALFNSSYISWLERHLLQDRDIASGLVFEFDEEILDCHLAASMKMFEMLRRAGSRTCISRFGKGLSSFRLYRELRPDYIKLDSGLIDTIVRDTTSQQFIRMVIEISHRAGCVVIAEGVETMAQREILERMYVDGIQGQLVSKTIAISEKN